MKRFFAFVLCLLVLFSVTAFAAVDTALQIIGCQQNDSELELLLYAKDERMFTVNNMTLTLNGKELPLKELNAFSSEKTGTAWVVVVEPTASQPVRTMNTNLIEGLITRMGPQDRIAVMNARSREITAFVRDVPTAKGFARLALEERGDVKLYDAIHSAVNVLRDMEETNIRKCLVVLSSCVDKGSIYTLSELCGDIQKTELTVYTVGLTMYTGLYEKAFQELSRISDATPSGFAFRCDSFPDDAGVTAARQILDNDRNFCVLTASLEGVDTDLAVAKLSLNGAQAQMDGLHLSPVDDPAPEDEPGEHEHVWNDDATCQHSRTCSICGEEDPEGTLAAHQYGSDGVCTVCGQAEATGPRLIRWAKEHLLIAVMAVVLVLLMLVLLIVFIVRARKKPDDHTQFPDDISPDSVSTTRVSKVTVELTNKATGEKCVGEIYDETIKAGRSAELCLESDATISREQMEFIWQNGILYVQDTNSANGTWVNGKEVVGATPLRQGDMIHVGESDFVVTWRSRL